MKDSFSINLDEVDNFSDYLMPSSEEIGKLKAAPDVNDELTDFIMNDSDNGAFLPWSKTTADFRIRPSEVTVLAAQNGAGKSVIVSQMCLYLLRERYSGGKRNRVLMISPEMSVAQNMSRAVRQIMAKTNEQLNEPDIGASLSWLGDRYYIYDHLGNVDPEVILGLIRYGASELGITHVVIDNLTCLKLTNSAADVNLSTKNFMGDLVSVSRDTGTHIFVVAHVRKPAGSQNERQDKYSIRGASEVSDLSDNVLLLQRDWTRGEKLNQLDPMTDSESYQEYLKKPSSYLEIAKQRHGEGTLRRYALWFDTPSLRFMSKPDIMPRAFEETESFHRAVGGKSSAGYQEH